MASDNRLTASLRPSIAEQIGEVAADREIADTEAERVVVREGLEAMGYVDRPTDATELFLWYLRRIGLILGLVGLIMMGYGVFGSRLSGVIGFGLLLAGFLFVALQEGLAAYEGRTRREPLVRRSKTP